MAMIHRVSILLIAVVTAAAAFAKNTPGGIKPTQLVVFNAKADSALVVLRVEGQNFCAAPVVQWNNAAAGLIGTATPSGFDVLLPAGVAAGSYLLTVTCGANADEIDAFDVSIGAVGPQGVQGAPGPQGLTGPAGPSGPQGVAGTQGPKGDTGATGAQGAEGPQGVQGMQGAQGPAGAQGLKGDTGATGSQGPEGAPGPAGAQGTKGDAGPAGPQGAQGSQGPAGPQGLKGDTGPAGPQGAAGADGAIGATGPAGPQGPIGERGPTGDPGARLVRCVYTVNIPFSSMVSGYFNDFKAITAVPITGAVPTLVTSYPPWPNDGDSYRAKYWGEYTASTFIYAGADNNFNIGFYRNGAPLGALSASGTPYYLKLNLAVLWAIADPAVTIPAAACGGESASNPASPLTPTLQLAF